MLERVESIVTEAGRIIEEVRSAGFNVRSKGKDGPVTEADRRADDYLRRELLGLLDVGWLSEETADNPDRLAERVLWVVDPLDGTKEFVQGIPEYSVAVALVEDGLPVLGVVHNPSSGETFAAAKDRGATLNGRPIAVREGGSILASRSEMKRGEFAPFMKDWSVSHVGSIEYKLGLVAAGKGAVTLSRGPKWEWDVCAGALLVGEAGGRISDAFGEPLRFNNRFPKVRGVLAGAPEAFDRARREVGKLGQSDRMNEMIK